MRIAPADRVYHEPAGSYATVVVLAVLMVGGGIADYVVTGLIVHVVGWLIALVLVCGIVFMATRTVRAYRSITVTSDEVIVGNRTLERSSIVGCERTVDPTAPVLGQTMREGMPRGVTGLALRLTDGGVLAVPTRRPDVLAAVLEVKPDIEDEVRLCEPDDVPELADIERRATVLYRMAGLHLPPEWSSLKQLDEAAAVLVAGRPAEGFARLGEIDGLAHLAIIAVVPPRIRSGLGRRLFDASCAWAREHGYSAMVATTFADVQWNAPYLAERGFVEITELSPGLVELRDWERAAGLDAIGRRIVMRLDL